MALSSNVVDLRKNTATATNVVDLRKQAYRARKNARHAAQDKVLEQVLALPDNEAVDLLYATWPEHLPRRARGRLSSTVRSAWRKKNVFAYMHRHFPDDVHEILEDNTRAYLGYLATPALARHEARIDALIAAMVDGIRGESTLAINISAPSPGLTHKDLLDRCSEDPEAFEDLVVSANMHAHYRRESGVAVFTDCDGSPLTDEVRIWLALGIDTAGSVAITETLSLRRMIKDDQGVDTWVPQVKSYGVSLSQGDWHPISTSDAAYAYGHDAQTGEPLPPEQGRSFGALRKPGWLSRTPPNTEHLD